MNDQALNIEFVKEVEKYPVLYNNSLPGYSRKDVKEKAWSEVGKTFHTTGAECKEKWKNLRTVFVRRLKSDPRIRTKKPYYLTEELQFTLPYLKPSTAEILSNISPEREDQESDNDTKETTFATPDSQQPPTPPPLPILESVKAESQQPDLTERYPQPTIITSSQNKKRGSRNEFVDKDFLEYLQAKKTKMTASPDCNASHDSTRRESLKMFLLSILPDLESMTDSQVRKFKRKSLQIIDEILDEQATIG